MTKPPFYSNFERPRAPHHLPDQHFGMGITPHDYLELLPNPPSGIEYSRCPFRNSYRHPQGAKIEQEANKYQISIDVQHFKAEEITIKIVDGFLIVEAKHEERSDPHGFISRTFTRRYALPEGVNPGLVYSEISSDGILTVAAPLKAPLNIANGRVVPIVKTGPVRKRGGCGEQ